MGRESARFGHRMRFRRDRRDRLDYGLREWWLGRGACGRQSWCMRMKKGKKKEKMKKKKKDWGLYRCG